MILFINTFVIFFSAPVGNRTKSSISFVHLRSGTASGLSELWQFGCRKKGKYLTGRFCFSWCACLHPSRLPSPSTTCRRVDRFPVLPWFLPSSTGGELVWFSGEKNCACVKFSWLSVNSLRVSTESKVSPKRYNEFMHHVQQNSVWPAAKCRDVQLQMLPGASPS